MLSTRRERIGGPTAYGELQRGRRGQIDGGGLDLVFGIVTKAWRSLTHVALMRVGRALVPCGAVPAALSLALPAPARPASITGAVASAVGSLVELFSKFSIWFGIGSNAACFGCAVINLVRGHSGAGGQGGSLRLVPKNAGRGESRFARVEPKAGPSIPFVRKDLLTPTELKFFKVLREAFPDVLVCPQVALAAVVDIPAYFNNNQYKYANRAPFAAKYADSP